MKCQGSEEVEGISGPDHFSSPSPIPPPHRQPSSTDLLEPSDRKSEAEVVDSLLLDTVSTCLALQLPGPVCLTCAFSSWD